VQIIKTPSEREIVAIDLVQRLAALVPDTPKPGSVAYGRRRELDVTRWIETYGLPVASSGPYQGGQKWILNPCPWNPAHVNCSAFIIQFSGGGITAG
jgi:hypothetical protein